MFWKLTGLLCFMLATQGLSSQNLVPNYLFEDWEPIDTFAWEKPQKWQPVYALDLISHGDHPQFRRSDTSWAGKYALVIEPAVAWDGAIYGEIFSQNFGFRGQPSAMKGYYRLDGGGNAFTAEVQLFIKDSLQQNYIQIASGTAQEATATATWQPFSVPIQYTQQVESERCTIKITFPSNNVPQTGSDLWLDAITFAGKVSGLEQPVIEPSFSVSPDYNYIYISGLNGGYISMINGTGQEVKHEILQADKHRLDVGNLSSGFYICSVIQGTQQLSYKFIKR